MENKTVSSSTKYIGKNLKYNDFEVINPDIFLNDLLGFSKSSFPKNHWELVIILIFGGMQSGKTTYMKHIADLGKRIYEDEFHTLLTNDLEYALDKLNEDIEKRTKVEFLFFDDMMKKGTDSRNSMSKENISISQTLAMVRHKLANENKEGIPDERVKNGFCVLTLAIQSPDRIDKFFREMFHLSIYKTYHKNLDKLVSKEDITFIKTITEDSMYKHIYVARNGSIGITATGKIMRLFFNKVDFEIPIFIKDELDISDLKEKLKEFDLDTIKMRVLKGFISKYQKENEIELTNSEIQKIIYESTYEQYELSDKDEKNININEFAEIFYKMRIENISYEKIARIFDYNKGNIHKIVKNYESQLAYSNKYDETEQF
jgi:hypothetical protein